MFLLTQAIEPKALASGLGASEHSSVDATRGALNRSVMSPTDYLTFACYLIPNPRLAPHGTDFRFERSEIGPLSPASDGPTPNKFVAGERVRVRGPEQTLPFRCPSPQPSPPNQSTEVAALPAGERELPARMPNLKSVPLG
jgi:hypothetical protein